MARFQFVSQKGQSYDVYVEFGVVTIKHGATGNALERKAGEPFVHVDDSELACFLAYPPVPGQPLRILEMVWTDKEVLPCL